MNQLKIVEDNIKKIWRGMIFIQSRDGKGKQKLWFMLVNFTFY